MAATRRRVESEIISAAFDGLLEPPVDLFGLAKELRVSDIRQTSFRDGYTDFSLDAPIIYINKVMLNTTKRFVLAHELAHVMLRLPEVKRLLKLRNRTQYFADEEAFVDRIAATILVPDSWIEALRKNRQPSTGLRDVARAANVSVMMLVARMASSGIDVALLHWRRGDDAWYVIDRPGVPPSLHGHVKPSSLGHAVLDGLCSENKGIVVDCHVNGRRAKIAGQGYRQGEHIFQFLEPSVDVWIAS
jgi:hypothetical protein